MAVCMIILISAYMVGIMSMGHEMVTALHPISQNCYVQHFRSLNSDDYILISLIVHHHHYILLNV